MKKQAGMFLICFIFLLSLKQVKGADETRNHSPDEARVLHASASIEVANADEPDDEDTVRLTKNEYDELVWKAKTYQELNPMKTSDPRERHGFSWDFFWGWVGGAFTTTLIYFFCFGDKKNGTKK
ncbi:MULTISPECIES: DUF1707 domain-containing protein [Gammaproteobacteria]|uniref:Uncharacterized protein n=6 Tax=Klebsiella pneumoniae TaxID=573 RepID=A0A9Q4X0L2_KLEPN|nr:MULTISPECIES: DUF1707 domain-containing protein [Gammaproteobacteria]MDU3756850.1 DUF1707 domain-containing protein [Veillonella sp.]ASF89361.1 hypothetical protein pPUTH1_0242 [Klebsiella pneumoniae]AZL04056.1 hypothetical protein CTM43_27465 [Klebsiella pneumoniae]EIV3098082.1 DUF1707 domain-containing protein [Klebsiella pneumoniae]EIV7897357.1 DUF1707 domain-containing protein [Klebsiella pneumoniae]